MADGEELLETGYGPDTPPDDSVLRQFLLNQSSMNRLIAECAGGRHETHEDVSMADAGSVVPYLNQAVLLRPLRSMADPVFDRIDTFFDSSAMVTLLSAWPTPDLTERGWVLIGHPMFVVAPPGAVATEETPGVTVTRVSTRDELETAERVVIDGYPVSEAQGAPPGSLLPAALLDSGMGVWLGLLDGEPVGVGAELTAHGVVNLAMDATLPQARRRGVWRSVVAARTGAAAHVPAVAFTSDFSRSGFVAMGFLPITRFTFWARPGS
jgi:hypothetical protein